MVAQLLSFPMRLQANGRLATVEQDSEDHLAEELAIIVLSRPGERPLVPTFGIEDPAFEDFAIEELIAQVDTFGVPVDVREVSARHVSESDLAVHLTFEGVRPDDES